MVVKILLKVTKGLQYDLCLPLLSYSIVRLNPRIAGPQLLAHFMPRLLLFFSFFNFLSNVFFSFFVAPFLGIENCMTTILHFFVVFDLFTLFFILAKLRILFTFLALTQSLCYCGIKHFFPYPSAQWLNYGSRVKKWLAGKR